MAPTPFISNCMTRTLCSSSCFLACLQDIDMFSPHECPRCRRSNIECAWARGPGCQGPWPWGAALCYDCFILCRFLRLGQLCRNRRLSLEIAHCIDQFCFDYFVYSRKSHQLYFLYCALLANRSEFQKFTFYHGRRLDESIISSTEDIIDRIFSYL